MKFLVFVFVAALTASTLHAATLRRHRRTPPAEVSITQAAEAAQRQKEILEAEKKNLATVKDETEATQQAAKQGGPIVPLPGVQVAAPVVPVVVPATADSQRRYRDTDSDIAAQQGRLNSDVATSQAEQRTDANVLAASARAQADRARIDEHTKTDNQVVAEQVRLRNELIEAQAAERRAHPEDTDLPRRQAEKLAQLTDQQTRLNTELVNAQVRERENANNAGLDAQSRIDSQRLAHDNQFNVQLTQAEIQQREQLRTQPNVAFVAPA